MEVLCREYWHATQEGSGPLLAATISPIAPPSYLNRLDAIYRDANAASLSRDISYSLTKTANAAIQYPNPEISSWTEIYSAYWYAIGAILAAEHPKTRPDWTKVYEAWKDLANTVIKGYSSGVLEAWTLPVLYTAGKHLRTFAIKADESAKASGADANFSAGGLQDDIGDDFGKNEKLEDAARVINRMFTLCISDRYVATDETLTSHLRAERVLNLLHLEHPWKNPENGASTTPPTYSSKPTSSSTPSASPKTSSVPSQPQEQTCHPSNPSPVPTSSPSNTTSASSSSWRKTTPKRRKT